MFNLFESRKAHFERDKIKKTLLSLQERSKKMLINPTLWFWKWYSFDTVRISTSKGINDINQTNKREYKFYWLSKLKFRPKNFHIPISEKKDEKKQQEFSNLE